MNYFLSAAYILISFALVVPITTDESSFEACLDEVRLRGGDAWAARNPRLPSEDCCPYKRAEDDLDWCTPDQPFNHPSWDLE